MTRPFLLHCAAAIPSSKKQFTYCTYWCII
nr:MAG TPA: hypothetical protein [Caudoviricetes sp.]